MLKLSLTGIYPNPFSNMLRIDYILPYDMRRIRFTLYDLRGRAVRDHTVDCRTMRGGKQSFYLGNGKGNSVIASGSYILKVTAVDGKGKLRKLAERTITCVKEVVFS